MSESTPRRFSLNEDPGVTFQKAVKKPIPVDCVQINEPFEVESLEGLVRGKPGDWLMRGVRGELYVCDREIFEQTYELVNEREAV
jgi:hypothetical protein